METLRTNLPPQEKLYERKEGGDVFTFEELSVADFPQPVLELLTKRHQMESDFRGSAREETWARALKATDPKITTFVASQLFREGDLELTYFIDTLGEDIAGEGTLLKGVDGSINASGNPVPGWSDNAFDHKQQGLGERRLALMNAFSRTFYQLPLRSSPEINGKARRLWAQLAQDGRAVMLDEKDNYGFPRYEFLK
jgi:hypothetical protein